jgi:hypothetical protein
MFIARKNIATRIFGFPNKIINDLRQIIHTEKMNYCEYMSLRVEKAKLIRAIKDPERLYTEEMIDFERVVDVLEWIVNENTVDAPLAAELLRNIAEREKQFRVKYGDWADFWRDSYRKEIIKEILVDGKLAEEAIERLLEK